jgi:hypothetical protein
MTLALRWGDPLDLVTLESIGEVGRRDARPVPPSYLLRRRDK